MPLDFYTREEVDAMMQDNLDRIRTMIDGRLNDIRAPIDKPSLAAFRSNHFSIFNATSIPVLPQGAEIYVDLRPDVNSSGIVAKYVSIGDRYLEEWAKQVNP